jgi:arabinofuranosyltransferase
MVRPYRLLAALLVLSGIFARVQAHLASGFIDDDAFITFRYADHLAHGQGFVYNLGERVLGTSTPLFTMLLAAGARAGVDPRTLAFGLDLLGYAAAAVLIYALLERDGRPWAGLFAMLLQLFALGQVMMAEIGGMETPLYVALILLAFLLYARNRDTASAVVAGLAALMRPEGALLGLVLGAHCMLERRRVPWRETGIFLLTVLPWVLFAWMYFGSPVPNSVWAKRAYFSTHDAASPWAVLSMFHLGRVRLLLGLLALLGAITTPILRTVRPVVAWLLAYLVFFMSGGVPVHYWYLLPYFVPLYVLAGLGLDFGLGSVVRVFGPRGAAPREVAITVATLLAVVALTAYGYRSYRTETAVATDGQRLLEHTHREVGTWLAQNTAASATVYAGDIGYVGWYSMRRILDPVGLVSPEAARWNLAGDPVGLIRERAPDACVVGMYGRDSRRILTDPWFGAVYRPVARFRDDRSRLAQLPDLDPARERQYVPDYAVFLRREVR